MRREGEAPPSGQLAPKIQETFWHLEPKDLTDDVFEGLLSMAGVTGASLPGRMAEIHGVLNVTASPLPNNRNPSRAWTAGFILALVVCTIATSGRRRRSNRVVPH